MTRGKKKVESSKVSKQEKKFHQKVKFNVPLKKNNSAYQKNKQKQKQKQKQSRPTPSMDMDMDIIEDDEDNDESTLPLDMLSDEENGIPNNQTDDDEDDQELESYERLPRSAFGNSNQQRPLLPIKTDRGQLIAQSVPIADEEIPDDDDEEEEQQNEEEKPSEPSKPVSIVELIAERENKLSQTKQTIVTLCDLIMKNPYEEISNLKQLRLLLNLGDPLISMTIRKLTMLSLVELFRDIVPGYRIRSLKEQTRAEDEEIKNSKNKKQSHKEKLSKDVKVIRNFEQTLLKHYQFFLHFLEQCVKKNLPENRPNKRKQVKDVESSKLSLGHLAIQCLCKLLTNLHNFNFRTNLLTIVVQYTASR